MVCRLWEVWALASRVYFTIWMVGKQTYGTDGICEADIGVAIARLCCSVGWQGLVEHEQRWDVTCCSLWDLKRVNGWGYPLGTADCDLALFLAFMLNVILGLWAVLFYLHSLQAIFIFSLALLHITVLRLSTAPDSKLSTSDFLHHRTDPVASLS